LGSLPNNDIRLEKKLREIIKIIIVMVIIGRVE
jgi:hypothetical protein